MRALRAGTGPVGDVKRHNEHELVKCAQDAVCGTSPTASAAKDHHGLHQHSNARLKTAVAEWAPHATQLKGQHAKPGSAAAVVLGNLQAAATATAEPEPDPIATGCGSGSGAATTRKPLPPHLQGVVLPAKPGARKKAVAESFRPCKNKAEAVSRGGEILHRSKNVTASGIAA